MSKDESQSESNPQPRDSRLEAFLRRGAGILAEQRQWSAQTQIKLKTLAKELNLPPELFQTALEKLSDPVQSTPPTRYEQAFCEYLEEQLENLPGGILSRPQERKTLLYGQQKYQLSPDVCERCVARVAEKHNIARISDVQALAYAQGEVSRLVSKSNQPNAELREHLQNLAQRWGLEPLQADRLLAAELKRLRSKRRRTVVFRIGFGMGVLSLSMAFLASLVWLVKLLTQSSPTLSDIRDIETPPAAADKEGDTSPPADRLTAPEWWTNNQREFLERLTKEGCRSELLAGLASQNAPERAEAYPQLWRLLGQWDEKIVVEAIDQPRWLRQPLVQESLLDWFWLEPDLTAVQAWVKGCEQLREQGRVSSNTPPLGVTSNVEENTQAISDFLMTTSAEHLLLRVYQRGLNDTAANPASPHVNSRLSRLSPLILSPKAFADIGPPEQLVESWRQRWLAEATERLYFRLQSNWEPTAEIQPATAPNPAIASAWKKSVASVSESLRLISDAPTRGRLIMMFWSGIAGVDPGLAAGSWSEVAAASDTAPTRDWGPLLESWSVTTPESEWSTRLLSKWESIAKDQSIALTGLRSQDVILLQSALQIEPIPTRFQKQLRLEWLLHRIRLLETKFPESPEKESSQAHGELRHLVTLAYRLASDKDLQVFDRLVRQSVTGTEPNPTEPARQGFVPQSEFAEVWARLTNARDREAYQEAVLTIAEWWTQDQLLSLPQAQQLTRHLLEVTKPEEQTSWLAAFKPMASRRAPRSQNPNRVSLSDTWAGTTWDVLLDQPNVAILMADHYANQWQSTHEHLAWLHQAEQVEKPEEDREGPPAPRQDSDRMEQELRRRAADRLSRWNRGGGESRIQHLADQYRLTFRLHRQLSDEGFATPSPNSSNPYTASEPLLETLVLHDQWSQELAQMFAANPTVWLAEYRRLVDQQLTWEKALWLCEIQVLKLLQQHLAKEFQ